jgi:hypothetical protein
MSLSTYIEYRFLASGLIQASSLFELLAPLYPGGFLLIASVSNIGKNIGWLATSATRASMNRGLTKEDNLGDVTAKSGYPTKSKSIEHRQLRLD